MRGERPRRRRPESEHRAAREEHNAKSLYHDKLPLEGWTTTIPNWDKSRADLQAPLGRERRSHVASSASNQAATLGRSEVGSARPPPSCNPYGGREEVAKGGRAAHFCDADNCGWLDQVPGPGSKRNGRRVDPAAGVGLSPNALRALQPGLSLRPGDGTSTPPLHVDRARSQCVRRPVFFDYQQERLRAAGGFGVDFTNHRARFVEELDPVLHLSAAWRSPPYAAPPSSIADVCQDYYASVRRQENGRRVAPGADLVRWTISGRSPGPHGDSVHNHALKNVLCRPVVLGEHSPPYDLGED